MPFDEYLFQDAVKDTKRLPEYFEPEFDWVSSTSLETLKNRTENDIKIILETIDSAAYSRFFQADPISVNDILDEVYPNGWQTGVLFHGLRSNRNPSKYLDLDIEDLSWSECYAAIALGHIHALLREEDLDLFNSETEKSSYFDNLAELSGSYLSIAMQCLTVIRLLNIDSAQSPLHDKFKSLKNNLRKNAQKAANAKYAPARRIKNDFIKWYETNEGLGHFHSQSQAAENYIDRHLSSEDHRYVGSPNTLIRALRKHRTIK